jgi:DNA polymerase III subunit beta
VAFEIGQPGIGTGAQAAGRDPRPADGMISFEAGGRRLIARLIAGEFIRYRSRFPAEFGCRAEVPAGPFTEAVRRVSLVAERASPVRLTFSSGTVVVEAHAEGRARAMETVAADFEGTEERVISFNPHYLLDGLGAAAAGASAGAPAKTASPAADGGERPAPAAGRIRLEFTSPAKPALITWAGNGTDGDAGTSEDGATGEGPPEFRYLVVPLRVPSRA